MARPKEYDRTDALNRAMLLFWEKGYERTSMQDLTQAMKISRSSIYEEFESKESLFLEALNLYTDEKQAKRLALVQAQSGNPKRCIMNLFETLVDDLSRSDIPKGCLLTETIANLEGINDAIKDYTRRQIENIFDLYKHLINSARRMGQITSAMSDESIAQLLISLHEGTIILSKSQDKTNEQKAVLKQFLDMI